MLFPLWGATARYERFLALYVILIVPGTSRGFFVGKEELADWSGRQEKGVRDRLRPTVFSQANKLGWEIFFSSRTVWLFPATMRCILLF